MPHTRAKSATGASVDRTEEAELELVLADADAALAAKTLLGSPTQMVDAILVASCTLTIAGQFFAVGTRRFRKIDGVSRPTTMLW